MAQFKGLLGMEERHSRSFTVFLLGPQMPERAVHRVPGRYGIEKAGGYKRRQIKDSLEKLLYTVATGEGLVALANAIPVDPKTGAPPEAVELEHEFLQKADVVIVIMCSHGPAVEVAQIMYSGRDVCRKTLIFLPDELTQTYAASAVRDVKRMGATVQQVTLDDFHSCTVATSAEEFVREHYEAYQVESVFRS